MNTSEYMEGVAAYFDGKSWFDNPYDISDDSNPAWDEWADGYEAAENGKGR